MDRLTSAGRALGDSRWIQTVRGVGFRLGYLAAPVIAASVSMSSAVPAV
ncbi:helix-turn-helix domain-containing protein [Krasilnikovia cinnamomea]|nr:helix-turn-helix domain-containing protein [Krasilnikovia cinnamomea]